VRIGLQPNLRELGCGLFGATHRCMH
jgi:hypothetical protein